jgi:hypothetical protein
MRTSTFRLIGTMTFLAAALLSCNFLTRVNTPAPSAVPSATLLSTPVAAAPGESGEYNGAVQIIGNADFVAQTRLALYLLETRAPDAYQKVQTYVGIIMQGEHSGMWAWENPPRYEVGDRTAFASATWYASTIAHDATHSELYHNGQEWEGIPAEQFCNAYQLEVLKQIGAPQGEIDYMAGLDGTHCDVDGDGDCDQADYENRDW